MALVTTFLLASFLFIHAFPSICLNSHSQLSTFPTGGGGTHACAAFLYAYCLCSPLHSPSSLFSLFFFLTCLYFKIPRFWAVTGLVGLVALFLPTHSPCVHCLAASPTLACAFCSTFSASMYAMHGQHGMHGITCKHGMLCFFCLPAYVSMAGDRQQHAGMARST